MTTWSPGPQGHDPARPFIVWSLAALLLGLHIVMAWWTRVPWITTGNDDAVYLLLSRSLGTGQYRDLFYIGAPIHSQYPPLYPGFLAVLAGLFGERLQLFIAVNVLISAVALLFFFDIARSRSATVALIALAIAALNPVLIELPGSLRSEPLCMALTGFALWSPIRLQGRNALLGTGLGAIAAALTRSAAVTVVLAVLMLWIHERRWRAVGWLTLGAALTVGAWLSWTAMAPDRVAGRSYVADVTLDTPSPSKPDSTASAVQPSDQLDKSSATRPEPRGLAPRMLSRITQNVAKYGFALLNALAVPSVSDTPADNLAWLLVIVGFGLAGWWESRSWWPIGMVALVSYGALLSIWPYAVARFLSLALPAGLIALVSGAQLAGRTLQRRWKGVAWPCLLPALLGAAILVGGVARTWDSVKASRGCRGQGPSLPGCGTPEEQAFYTATRYISDSTPASARFLAAKEATFYYYTGRPVLSMYQVLGRSMPDLPGYLNSNRAEYVFLSHLKLDEWALARPLLSMCGRLELVRRWDSTTLLLKVTDTPGTPNQACNAIREYALLSWGDRNYRREILP